MRSDRRTISVLAVFLCFLLLGSQFRSLFFLGTRLLAGQVDQVGMSLMSTTDESDSVNLGAWSLTGYPTASGPSRDERLGLVIVRTMREWNRATDDRKESIKPLEDYCKDNPDDLRARAHLLRLALNIPSLSDTRDKTLLMNQARRLDAIAVECAFKEPNNWYWRDRRFHLLMLLEEPEKATDVLTAKPLPDSYQDYVDDEVMAKEALYRGQYWNLPQSVIYALWAETNYSHFNAFSQLNKLTKTSPRSMDLRVAEMEMGRAMMNSSSSSIAALVGLRNMRHGLWHSANSGKKWEDQVNLAEQAKVEAAYKKAASDRDWQFCLKAARENLNFGFMIPEDEYGPLYVGQFGPIALGAGLLCTLAGLASFGLARMKVKSITSDNLASGTLLLALTITGLSWAGWRSHVHASFGASLFLFPLVALFLVGSYIVWKLPMKQRLAPFIILFVGLTFGVAAPWWQASSILFLLIFAIQKGKGSLSPWVSGACLLLLAYHTCLNLAYSHASPGLYGGFLVGVVGVLAVSRRSLDPDEPRLASVTFGMIAIILGTFLTAQYDKGLTSNIQAELDRTVKIRQKVASLYPS